MREVKFATFMHEFYKTILYRTQNIQTNFVQ